ncbi:MAG: protein kinase [Candidatus Eisenbacteria bacterium]|uniref:Protein kinase n=1 Tax=Eiseniibacteriota bacterium TaxID=2212470 RepID=A0A933SEV2_UNCEI|nr:protein kinase [Candidatus Eisenbacteria bacterium]
MALTAGDKLGPYEIVAPLGAGGMGEVYRARDTRLHREVALKVLPTAFAQDPERIARFEREAKLLASLNHPHIGALYGLEESEGRRVLVLELVAGESLAERLRRGPMPLDEALPIACQIASALEAAHESGVVHRDLKPGNVMLRPDGTIKVLDFGLAKGGAGDPKSSDPQLSASPTMTYAATQAGVILGTAAYMSPEQARGRAVDRRSDIWSFGCVLLELLTGRPAFAGETVSDTLASILKSEPDWITLPAGTPRRVSELLRRCLRKDPASRLRDAGDARIALEEILASPEADDTPVNATAAPAVPGVPRGALALVGAVAVAALAFAGWTAWRSSAERSDVTPMRFALQAPAAVTPTHSIEAFAISPDGTGVAFVGQDSLGNSSIWLRKLDALVPVQVPNTENAFGLFWSPDSRQIAFFTDGKLKTVALAGGVVRTLCDAPDPRGASWGSKGTIVLAPAATGPLYAVSADGGEPTVAVEMDTTKRENSLRYPVFMPDGEHLLFVALPRLQASYSVVMTQLGSKSRHDVMTADAAPAWAGTGHVITTLHDRLVAIPMDPKSGKVNGKPVDLGEAPLLLAHDGCPAVSASNDGTLAFTSGSLANTELVWIDRSGHRIGTIPVPVGRWETFAISADGKRLAVGKRLSASETKLWTVDLATGQGGPLADIAPQASIAWSPDGRMLAYQKLAEGMGQIFLGPANGGEERRLVPPPAMFENLWTWSPDGKLVFFSQPTPGKNWDVWSAPVDGSSPPQRVVSTVANENGAALSPDSRWMLYTSDESGRTAAYVRSYPSGDERRQLGALGLGATTTNYFLDWSRDGREILVASDEVVSYPATLTPELRLGAPRRLFTMPSGSISFWPAPGYQRFLVSRPLENAAPPQLTVLSGWWSALKKK